jgi:hypothetical protein
MKTYRAENGGGIANLRIEERDIPVPCRVEHPP